MAGTSDLTKMVPGFDFLQGLMKNAGAGLPSMGQWIAPTLDPQELGKRIEELRTVQFWLEQNAKLLATTIQALEVQRMTLSTLQTMNLPLTDLRESLKIATPPAARASGPSSAAAAPAAAELARAKPRAETDPKSAPAPATKAAPAVDPMQWWGALTQQFTELASNALRESSAEAARQLAGAAVKPGAESASSAIKKATATPAKVAGGAAKTASGATTGVAKAAAKLNRRRGG